jgi:hypothetical protein
MNARRRTARSLALATALAMGATAFGASARAADTIKDDAADAAHKAAVGVKSMAFDAMDKRAVTIDFDAGSAVVSAGEARDIEALLKSFDPGMAGGEVTLAAWSDKALPPDGAKLADADTSLAKGRLAAVKAQLEKLGVTGKIESYDMSSAANPIAKLLATDDAKVKDAYKTTSADSARVAEVAHYLRTAGGPNKAVVVFHAPITK